MNKIAIVILADPGTEESTGRVFNALAVAYDARRRGDKASVLFQGTGTRWAALLADPQHALHGLYAEVGDSVAGVSCGCADVFGAGAHGLATLQENPVPGTSGLPSLVSRLADGWQVLIF